MNTRKLLDHPLSILVERGRKSRKIFKPHLIRQDPVLSGCRECLAVRLQVSRRLAGLPFTLGSAVFVKVSMFCLPDIRKCHSVVVLD